MTTQEIVAKLWNLCNVLRDDGITYQDYVTELTYILFLKMANETGAEEHIPEEYRWDVLSDLKGGKLLDHYKKTLQALGGKEQEGADIGNTDINRTIRAIYKGASTSIRAAANLEKIVKSIDDLDWFSARDEGLGDLYEGLLEKNANEKKSGAGQYFTPRPLIDVMTRLVKPQPGERCNDKRQAYLIQANGKEKSPKPLDIRGSGDCLLLGASIWNGHFRRNRPTTTHQALSTGANEKEIV